jgi:hypothetical protein
MVGDKEFIELCKTRRPFFRKPKQGDDYYLQVAVKDNQGKLVIYKQYGNAKYQGNWDMAKRDYFRFLEAYVNDDSLEYVDPTL